MTYKKLNNFFLKVAFSTILLASSSIILAQVDDLSINEDFLASLPEEARDELLKQIESDKADLSDVDYGVFSSLLDFDLFSYFTGFYSSSLLKVA